MRMDGAYVCKGCLSTLGERIRMAGFKGSCLCRAVTYEVNQIQLRSCIVIAKIAEKPQVVFMEQIYL